MSELEELRRRVDALEGELGRLTEVRSDVRRLRDESLTTRSFAGMIDRQVAELRTVLRGHTKVLNALRETQVEQGRALQGMAEVVGGLVTGQTAMAGQMTAVREDQSAMRGQLQRIADRLDAGS